MPTGYTAGVQDGTITGFKQFALLCARDFGACLSLRDKPLSSDIPEFKVDPFYQRNAKLAEKALEDWLAMDEPQRRTVYAQHIKETEERNAEVAKKKQQERQRYEAMLEKARKFNPPTQNHNNLAKFMVEQLEGSIRLDCRESSPEKVPAFERWQEQRQRSLRFAVRSSEQVLREQTQRVAEQNEWVRQLREALDAMQAAS